MKNPNVFTIRDLLEVRSESHAGSHGVVVRSSRDAAIGKLENRQIAGQIRFRNQAVSPLGQPSFCRSSFFPSPIELL